MLAIAPAALPAFHPALLLMAQDEKQCDVGPVFLDRHGAGGDAWGMEQQDEPLDSQFKTANNVEQDNFATDVNGDLGILDGMTSSATLGERILFAINNRYDKEMSKSGLGRAIGVSPQTLAAMCRHNYNRPEDWTKVKLLALNTGWSYRWISTGQGKTPVRLTEDESIELRMELNGPSSVAPAPAASDSRVPAGELLYSELALMKLWGMVAMHSRARAAGWNADDVFACVLQLYRASNAGRASAEFIDKFIQDFPASR